ncbi:hypothetical protein AVEN_33109-1 [Araneus ventricosus]|uniref:Uncharacterized protein n=1 Tax=Araneus ventricosus TaxID=182803 RepID=A0A4Y2CTS3_ARAVE|nr:hypothetical protein AVEN_33109-1 [Araneus ventricosus]
MPISKSLKIRLTALSSAGEEEAGSKSPAVTTAQPSPSIPARTAPIYDYERVRHVPGMAKKKGYTAPGPTKVPYHPFNYQMAAVIFMRVVSRYGTVTMRCWMKPLTAPPGGKRWSVILSKTVRDRGKKVNYKVVQYHLFNIKRHLVDVNA